MPRRTTTDIQIIGPIVMVNGKQYAGNIETTFSLEPNVKLPPAHELVSLDMVHDIASNILEHANPEAERVPDDQDERSMADFAEEDKDA